MGVMDGQPVSAAITNPAFINKNINDSMPNILGFTRALSGASIADIQVAVNKLYTATGASETQTGTVYNATPGTITNGQDYQTALTELAGKFDPATGHFHTGAAGDGPILNVVLSAAVTGSPPITGNLVFIPGNGVTLVESGHNITISATGGTTLAVTGNTPVSGAITFIPGSGISISQGGNIFTFSSTGGGGGGTTGPLTTPNSATGSFGVSTGFSLFWPYLTIPNGDTGTVSAGSELVSITSIIVQGMLINNGIVRVL